MHSFLKSIADNDSDNKNNNVDNSSNGNNNDDVNKGNDNVNNSRNRERPLRCFELDKEMKRKTSF